jgi:hypothetical protein
MRLRLAGLACALTALGIVVAPGLASAAPHHNHGLTIAATPNPIIAGEGVLIYGQLSGPDHAGQLISLYHRLDGTGRGFSRIGTTRTDSFGFYEFTREEGIVYTNRDWFVRGPEGTHSRTVHERVAALVTLAASTTQTDTAHRIIFAGHVTPNHAFERVFLQEQNGSSDDWSTLASAQLGPGSNYVIAYRWARPGVHDVRVLFRGDARNVRAPSDTMNGVVIQQAQVRGFSINTSAPIVDTGGSTTISGVLDQPGATTPEPDVVVQLWGRHPGQPFAVLADATTGQDGSYSFNQTALTTNTVYDVATLRMPHTPSRHTALLYQGVRDVVTMTANTGTATTGQTVTFTGTVLPDKADHVIYLQQLGKDGDFHTVEVRIVRNDSTFQFAWMIGSPGTHAFRARITSDKDNIGSASMPPMTVTATAPPAESLPPAS